jgi:hypothetical protein
MITPLLRFMGVPDPLPDALEFAARAKILEHVGGPTKRVIERIRKDSALGVSLNLYVPRGGNGTGVRALVRAKNFGPEPAMVRLGARKDPIRYNSKGEPVKDRNIPRIDTGKQIELSIPPGGKAFEAQALLPAALGARPGRAIELVLLADRSIEVEAVAVVPLADELAPPPPEPWQTTNTERPPAEAD